MIDTWHTFLDWMTDYGILISSIISVLITLLSFFEWAKNYKKIALIYFGLTVLLSLEFYPIQVAFFPFSYIAVFTAYSALYLLMISNKTFVPRWTYIACAVQAVMFLYSVECASACMNTWGSGAIYAGVFMLVHQLPGIQLNMLSFKRILFWAYYKIALGIGGMGLVLYKGFYECEYGGDTVNFLRKSLVLVSGIFIIEGILLMIRYCKNSKESE